MVLISDNGAREASKVGVSEGSQEESVEGSSSAPEDVWEIVNHLLKSYNQQQNKSKPPNSGTNLQDLIPTPGQAEDVCSDLTHQNEVRKEKKIEQLAQEFGQQTASTIQCPISEHLQVINEEDLAAILPDVENTTSGSFDEFDTLANRTSDAPSTLVESLSGPYDDVILLSEHSQTPAEAVIVEKSPSNHQSIHEFTNSTADFSESSTTNMVEQMSSLHIENSDLMNPSIYSWLLKPSESGSKTNGPLVDQSQSAEQKLSSDESSEQKCRRSSRNATKLSQNQSQENGSHNPSNIDIEPSIKIDCSVSHISLDSGFGGSPSYTSSPTSAYLYSPMSVDNKSPNTAFRSSGTRTFYEANVFKGSQSPTERTQEKNYDCFHDEVHLVREGDTNAKKRRGRPKKNKDSNERTSSNKSRKGLSSDICSLVEKLISIEEKSKKVVKKSPNKERIEKVRRWLKLERKKKSKKAIIPAVHISPDIDSLVSNFRSFSIADRNPHQTRASNNKLNKSKYRCKCCAEFGQKKRNFNLKSTNKRKDKPVAEHLRETVSSERTNMCGASGEQNLIGNRKKVKKNAESCNEKYEQRLPLKKRMYRVPISSSHCKSNSSATSSDCIKENKCSSSNCTLSEFGEAESCLDEKILPPSEGNGAINTVPVSPKKRFQLENISYSSGFKGFPSITLKKVNVCNASSANPSDIDSSSYERNTRTKGPKISNEICKRVKPVTMNPSEACETFKDLPVKHDRNVTKNRKKIICRISTRFLRGPFESKIDKPAQDGQDECENLSQRNTTVITGSQSESDFLAELCTERDFCETNNPCDTDLTGDNSADRLKSNHTGPDTSSDAQNNFLCKNQNSVGAFHKKKRKRTINRTGFPTKKKKKKHTAATDRKNFSRISVEELSENIKILAAEFNDLTCSKDVSDLTLSKSPVENKNKTTESSESTSSQPHTCELTSNVCLSEKSEFCQKESLSNLKLDGDFFSADIIVEPKRHRKHTTKSQKRKLLPKDSHEMTSDGIDPIKTSKESCDIKSNVKKVCPAFRKFEEKRESRTLRKFKEESDNLISREFKEKSNTTNPEKKYLSAGLFSNQYKVNDSVTLESEFYTRYKPEENDCGLLPPPPYYAKWVQQRIIDFTLPFDIWLSHRKEQKISPSTELEESGNCEPSSVSAKMNSCCDSTFNSDYKSSASSSSLETVENQNFINPSVSFSSLDECDASSCDTRATSQDIGILTDEQKNFIRINSCFLIRNLNRIRRKQTLKSDCDERSRSNFNHSQNFEEACGNGEELLGPGVARALNISFMKSEEKKNASHDPFVSLKNNQLSQLRMNEIPSIKVNYNNSMHCNCASQSKNNVSPVCGNCSKLDSHDCDSLSSFEKSSDSSMEAFPSHAKNRQKYLQTLVVGDFKIQVGDNVYVTKDTKAAGPDNAAVSTNFGNKSCNVFHVERLWHDENNDGFAYGHYFLRPHETFHEPSRKFFPNELMKSPLSETISVKRIVGHCHVLDLNSFCKGKPVAANMEHVFICEYRVDKAAKTFSRIPKRKARFSSDVALEFYHAPLKPVRSFKPYDLPKNLRTRKKRLKSLNSFENNDFQPIPSTAGLAQNPPPIVHLVQPRKMKTTQEKHLDNIVLKLSAKVDSM